MVDNLADVSWHGIFLCAGAGFLSGIWLADAFRPDWALAALALLLSFAVWLAFHSRGGSGALIFRFMLPVFLFGAAAGLLRVSLAPDYSRELDPYLGQKVSFRATVADFPDEREAQVYLTLLPEGAHARVIASVERFPRYRRGDRLLVSGRLEAPKSRAATGTEAFDYREYLAKSGIFYSLYRPRVELAASSPGFWLDGGREALLGASARVLPEPEASLSSGILFGAKQGLGQEWNGKFRRAGVSHVLVLSGYNITLVASSLLAALSWLPRLWGGLAAALGIVAFGLLASGGSAAWRAVIMALLALYARLAGRESSVPAALMFAAVAMVLWNPAVLARDAGFQLSFLALLGLVCVSPLLAAGPLRRIPERFGLRELASTTLGAQAAVFPLLWRMSGELPLAGFLSNLAIVPLVPSAMLFGFWPSLVGLLSPGLGRIAAVPAWLVLAFMLRLVSCFAAVPLGFAIPPPAGWAIAALYAAAGLFLWRRHALRPPGSLQSPDGGT